MTHSPSPWHSCRGKNLRINDADGVYICSISRRGKHGESAEVIANMDLIEAAPELLEALKEIMDGIVKDCRDDDCEILPDSLYGFALSAIAKATGAFLAERRPASPTITLNAGRSSAEDEEDDCRNDHEHDRKEWRDGR